MSDYVVIVVDKNDALELGLLTCTCGHRANNHFEYSTACARCECDCYEDRAVKGQLITDELCNACARMIEYNDKED